MMQIDPEKMYTRAALARALDIDYHCLYAAERRGEIPAPGFPMWRRRFYTFAETQTVLAWANNRVRCAK